MSKPEPEHVKKIRELERQIRHLTRLVEHLAPFKRGYIARTGLNPKNQK